MQPLISSNRVAVSILIPVYNYPVTALVNELISQIERLDAHIEIVVLDDASTRNADELASLKDLAQVTLFKNHVNQGRDASRKKLSSLAKNEFLLFLDGDSAIISDDFISRYVDLAKQDKDIVCGGRVYSETKPSCDFMLHWKYGSIRERGMHTAFMSNNFLIKKDLFDRLDSSVALTGYGHEDSWWGIQFEQWKINVERIDNPVLHLDLQSAEEFINKSGNALANLLILEKKIAPGLLAKHVKIFRFYQRIKKLGMAGIFLSVSKFCQQHWKKNLLSCGPSLFYFDCYRLGLLIQMDRDQNK